jgi:hypothetical protein
MIRSIEKSSDLIGKEMLINNNYFSTVCFVKKDFSVLHSVQASSGAHPAFYPMGTAGYFPGR